jgi:hypothetical protein
MYQVMYVKDGKWLKHGEPFRNFGDAKAERDYLAFALGLHAQVFRPIGSN